MYEVFNLVEKKTCFKNMQNPTCSDLLSINVYAFQQTIPTCTCLSDWHKLVLLVLKTMVPWSQQKETTYRDYKQFNFSNAHIF